MAALLVDRSSPSSSSSSTAAKVERNEQGGAHERREATNEIALANREGNGRRHPFAVTARTTCHRQAVPCSYLKWIHPATRKPRPSPTPAPPAAAWAAAAGLLAEMPPSADAEAAPAAASGHHHHWSFVEGRPPSARRWWCPRPRALRAATRRSGAAGTDQRRCSWTASSCEFSGFGVSVEFDSSSDGEFVVETSNKQDDAVDLLRTAAGIRRDATESASQPELGSFAGLQIFLPYCCCVVVVGVAIARDATRQLQQQERPRAS